jgi:protein ImuB
VTDSFSASPRLYCAIHLPLLSADRWLREAGPGGDALSPRVFTEKQKSAMRIAATNEVARDLGLSPGMTLADARARVPDVQAVPHDPPADAALLGQLAEGCDRYTPSVALDAPDGLILDITGCAHIWGGEAALIAEIAGWLAHQGMTVRIAIAATPDRARALARHGGEQVAVNRQPPPGAVNEARAPYVSPPLQGRGRGWGLTLPVAALDLPADAETALRRAGLHSIDDLAVRPRRPLAARFGAEATARLARVLGEEDVRIVPLRPVPAFTLAHRFAEPVARTDHMLAAIAALAEDMAETLREHHAGGRRFTVSLFRSDGAVQRLSIATGGPARDPALVMRLLRERIDALADPLDPGFGYDLIRFDVPETEPLAPRQTGFAGEADETSLAALLDRLGVRLGAARVRRLALGDSHIPECAGFSVPAQAPILPFPPGQPEPGEPPRRPLHLFDPPQRIEVIAEVPDGPPRRFRWRRALYEVVAHEGPERLAAEWWKRKDGRGLTRDYYRVEDAEGHRFWLFRHGLYGAEQANPGWYLHGAFA